MIFNSNVFLFVFLPLVFALYWAARTKAQRYILLTISGYIFYGYWNWRFCFLLLFSSLVSFFAALAITDGTKPFTRRGWLALSIGTDLLLLGFFKYFNFFTENFNRLGLPFSLPLIHVVLPIGISFYTFHTISYILDVAAGRVKATRNIFEYFGYVCLFSQLVAGPIVRYREIEDDLENIDRPLSESLAVVGIGTFIFGLAKKVLIADQIAALVNPLLQSYTSLSPLAAWGAALGYAYQLYFDFSGYSDMAIGLGLLFGLHIPINFNAPYRAEGIGDFWRRWHISLSSWLRDYLYIPLGGSRGGSTRTALNLMATMLLGGLWHGANWTFVLWGAFHGALLVTGRYTANLRKSAGPYLTRLVTFLLVVLGWVLFRSDNMHMAGHWLQTMFGAAGGSQAIPLALAVWIGICLFLTNVMPETSKITFPGTRKWIFAYAAGFYVCYLFMNQTPTVFLYYQF